MTTHTNRRDFLRTTAAAGLSAALAPTLLRSAEPARNEKMIGMQIGAVSFVDEGVPETLDILQSKGAVNTLFLTTFTYGRGLAGRQIPGQPFPDHGKQESDEQTFHGGNYARPHPEFYSRTVLNQTRAPEFGNLDIVTAVLPEARKRR